MPIDPFNWKGGAGRKINTALPSQLPGKIVNPPGGDGQGVNVSRVTRAGQTGHSVTQPSQVSGNVKVTDSGRVPDGVQDAQFAHDLADMSKRGQGGTETHARGPEWLRSRVTKYQDRLFRTTLLPGDQGEGNK